VPFKCWGWTYKNERIFGAAKAMQAPELAWIAGSDGEVTDKAHNFTAGEAVEKSAALIYDRVGRARWHLAWRVVQENTDAALFQRTDEVVLGSFDHRQASVRFTAPEVDKPANLTLELNVTDADTNKQIAADSFAITVYPKVKTVAAGTSVTIYDPVGDTSEWLASRGVTLQPYNADAPPKNVVIGRKALEGRRTLPYTAEQIAAGLRVFIFEQHCNALGSLGFRHEDRKPRRVFPRIADHPLAAGLPAEAFSNWHGSGTLFPNTSAGDRQPLAQRLYHSGSRGSVASAIIETPQHGPFNAILDCEFDLAYTPLMTWQHGKGEIVFCQLDLTGRVGLDPAATRIADELVRYMGTPSEQLRNRTADTAWLQGSDAHHGCCSRSAHSRAGVDSSRQRIT